MSGRELCQALCSLLGGEEADKTHSECPVYVSIDVESLFDYKVFIVLFGTEQARRMRHMRMRDVRKEKFSSSYNKDLTQNAQVFGSAGDAG